MYYTINEEFLMHFGVPGMKWGVRKAKSSSGSSTKKDKYDGLSKKDYKERKKIHKVIEKDSKRIYRTHDPRVKNRMKVNKEFSKDFNSNKKIQDAWDKTHKAYNSGDLKAYNKHLLTYQTEVNKLSTSYNKKRVDALLKDVGLTKISDINKQYLYDVNSGKKRMTK